MGKRGPRRTNIQRERDLVTVAELYLKGYSQGYIANEVSKDYEGDPLTRQQISYDIKKLIKRWQKSQLMDMDDAKARELAKVDALELTYWQAWERSCEDAETVTEKGKGTGAEVQGFEKTIQRKGQAGDPRFLTGVQWCIERRCKILGVDAPIEQRHSGTGEKGAIIFRYVDNLPPDAF